MEEIPTVLVPSPDNLCTIDSDSASVKSGRTFIPPITRTESTTAMSITRDAILLEIVV
jgi:hypothetical protein